MPGNPMNREAGRFLIPFPSAFGQFLLLGALSAIVALTVAACGSEAATSAFP